VFRTLDVIVTSKLHAVSLHYRGHLTSNERAARRGGWIQFGIENL